jgi:hypothetical protein
MVMDVWGLSMEVSACQVFRGDGSDGGCLELMSIRVR